MEIGLINRKEWLIRCQQWEHPNVADLQGIPVWLAQTFNDYHVPSRN